MFLKSWDLICLPKWAGGIDIRKTEDLNKALVAKLSWEVASNSEKKWVQIFRKKYVQHRNFMKMQFPKFASWAAISIFKCRDVLRNGLCHKIGNEWGTCIWEDPWVPKIPRFIPTSSNDTSSSDVYVACLIDHDSRQWDHGKLFNLFDTETVMKILKINLPHHQQNDQIFWSLSKSALSQSSQLICQSSNRS